MSRILVFIQKICIVITCLALSACSGPLAEKLAQPSAGLLPPTLNPITVINRSLREMPPPESRIAIAVYGFTDQTGQFKPADTVQSLSRAVTQGATSVLIKALQDVGEGSWFRVVERERLDNLLKERHIIADMRERYLGERVTNPRALPPLLFAGVLLEGGIIGYDSNTRTGGAGARYLAIGGDVNYREDTVTIYLRAISTKTGEVLLSTVAHKTVVSVGIQGDAFKYVAFDKILEAEAGITTNEPEQIAVQQAIEKSVYALVVEGADRGLWAFADRTYQDRQIEKLREEQGIYSMAQGPPQPWTTTTVADAKASQTQRIASSPEERSKAAPAPTAAQTADSSFKTAWQTSPGASGNAVAKVADSSLASAAGNAR